MTSSRWQATVKIFEAALDLAPSERSTFIHDACDGDPELESEILRLLEADDGAGSFLEKSPLSTIAPRTTSAHEPPHISAGSIVSDRFKILRFIGQGGMGQVYEAFDLELRARIALKAIRHDIASDPQMLSRFRREVQLTRLITHPNVCRTFDIERHLSHVGAIESDITFLTMELLEGETLASLLRRKRFSPTEAFPLILQMIEALSAAHTVGVVHRDFKPSNVVLVPSGSNLRAVVTDFGLARSILHDRQLSTECPDTSLTASPALMGTLIYMAPEQFERGETSVASDIYSFGLVIYEMITGQRPFADPKPFAEATKRLKQPAPSARASVPELDLRWEGVISRCLALEPESRFESAKEVAETIINRIDGLPWRPFGEIKGRPRSRENTAQPRWFDIAIGHKKVAFVIAIALFVSLFLIVFRYWIVSSDAKLPQGSTVLLTDIQNDSGDKRFDSTTELIRHQLSQSPHFGLLDVTRIRTSLQQMEQAPDAVLTPATARGIALRNGVSRVIFGTVSRVGDSYVLDVDVEQPDNNPQRFRSHWENHWNWTMPSGETGGELPPSFLSAVRDSCDWIRSQIGEASNDIARENVPPEDVTTGNWEALSEFSQAEKFRAAGQNDSAIIALQNAIAADPKFALAYGRLGDILNSLARFREGDAAYGKALTQAQKRLTRRERDRVRGLYAIDSGDYATAEAAFRDYTAYFPNDYLGWFYRGFPLMMMGHVEEAITSLKKAAEIDSTKRFALAHIARYNLILGDYEDAAKWIRRLRDAGQSDSADLAEGELNFLQSNFQNSRDRFTKLTHSKDILYQSYGYSLLARLFAEQRQYPSALDAIEKGIHCDLESGNINHRADKILDRAYIHCKLGNYEACLQDTRTSLDLDRSLQRSQSAATLLGQAAYRSDGRITRRFTSELRSIQSHLPTDKIEPLSDIVKAHVFGEVLLAQGQGKRALREFSEANRLEAPTSDKEYLARALLASAKNAPDEASARELKARARAAYSALALKPGLVWQWARDYFPGYASDSASRVREGFDLPDR